MFYYFILPAPMAKKTVCLKSILIKLLGGKKDFICRQIDNLLELKIEGEQTKSLVFWIGFDEILF